MADGVRKVGRPRKVDANNSKKTATNSISKEADKPSVYTCVRCGKQYKTLNKFPFGKSELFKGWDNHLPVCSDCLIEVYNQYLEKYAQKYVKETDEQIEMRAIKRVCMLYDMYYSENIVKSAIKANKTTSLIQAYIKQINLWQHRNKDYDTTLEEEERVNISMTTSSETQEDGDTILKDVRTGEEVSRETVEFFGDGLGDVADYRFLQNKYDEWVTGYECQNPAQVEIFKRLSINQWETWKAQKAGLDTSDLNNTFQKFLDIAKIQPKQNSADAFSEAQTFGTLIDKWENTRPLPEIDESLRDVDKIGVYIDVWFKGHLSKMMGLKNGFSKLYEKVKEKYTVHPPQYVEDEDSQEVKMSDIFAED